MQLTYIINAILRLQHWPSQWKCVVVVPILKPNKNEMLVGSYRPISLLSAIFKLVEKIILIRLDAAQDELNINDECQFRFRRGRGTVQQVVRIVNNVKVQYNLGKNTTMVLLDIEKAFDTVWIPGLLYKLNALNFPTYITKLFHSFLTGRSLQVRVNNKLSTRRDIRARVPQGSCLSPKLYNLFVSDFPEFPKTKLADDTAMYAHSHNAQAEKMLLKAHMARATAYYDKWKIRINAEKSEAIVFTRRFTENKILTPISMGDSPLTRNITRIRQHNAPFRIKHLLPYQTLPIFRQRI